MELVDFHKADDENLRRECKPAHDAGVAHSGKNVDPSNETTTSQISQDTASLQGFHLVALLSCIFLGNFTIGFVGVPAVQNEQHSAHQKRAWTVLTRLVVGQQLHWHSSRDSHRPV